METISAISEIATELWAIASDNWQGYDQWCNSSEYLLRDPRVRQLGEQANRIGGFAAMAAVADEAFYQRIRAKSPDASLASACITEINWIWHGIGDWQH